MRSSILSPGPYHVHALAHNEARLASRGSALLVSCCLLTVPARAGAGEGDNRAGQRRWQARLRIFETRLDLCLWLVFLWLTVCALLSGHQLHASCAQIGQSLLVYSIYVYVYMHTSQYHGTVLSSWGTLQLGAWCASQDELQWFAHPHRSHSMNKTHTSTAQRTR